MSDDDYLNFELPEEDGRQRSQELSYTKRRIRALNQQERKGYNRPALSQRETFEKGIATEIPSDNKGFQLLAKMGFKKGMALGKNAESAIKEPIAIEMRSSKFDGLGKKRTLKSEKTEAKEREERIIKMAKTTEFKHDKFEAKLDVEDFRVKQQQAVLERFVVADVEKLRKAVRQLDEQNGINASYFWSEEEQGEEREMSTLEQIVAHSEDQDQDIPFYQLSPNDQLLKLNEYAREKYFYCLWCGCCFNDLQDLQDNCPGNSRLDHDE